MKLVNIICGAQDSGLTPNAVSKIKDPGLNIELFQYSTSELDGDERTFRTCLENAKDSYAVIVRMHAGITYFKKFGKLKDFLIANNIPAFVESEVKEEMIENRSLFSGTDEEYLTIRKYMELGGSDNEFNLLKWMLRDSDNADIDVEDPKKRAAQGIYVPGKGMAGDIDVLIDKNIPTVGVLMSQIAVVGSDTEHIDSLISELGSRNVNVIPVFVTPNPGEITGSVGINGTIRKYLMHNGKAIVDSIIITMGFSQICLSSPGDGSSAAAENIFAELNVPVIQASTLFGSKEDWHRNSGFGPFEISMNVFWPEYDGQVLSFPFASRERSENGTKFAPLEDRISAVSELAVRWAVLKRTGPNERKVAILLHQNPPRNDMIGGAFGLDAQESTVALMRELKEKGYTFTEIPKNGQELTKRILEGVSNDTEWLTAEEMKERCAAFVTTGTYAKWFSSIDEECREKMMRDWGDIPGALHTVDGGIVIPGMINGNVFIGLQPNRGTTDASVDIYHSQDITAPHNYLAYYKWLTEEFGAQAIIHMGCHGTLEWLPGKGNAVSGKCFPDVVFGHIPHIYPYAISNPGEGVHAKRRTCAVIVDHLIPAHTRAESYDDLAEIEALVQEYLRSRSADQKDKCGSLVNTIFDKCMKTSLLDDIGLTQHSDLEDLENKIETLYDYICSIKDNVIKDGLHILGSPPAGERMNEMIYSLTRIRNGNVLSLRQAVADVMKIDLANAMNAPSEMSSDGTLNGELIDRVDERSMELIRRMDSLSFKKDDCVRAAEKDTGHSDDLDSVIGLICDTVVPMLKRTNEEISNVIRSLDGEYILPGPSGCPTRGNVHLLPTGRNFYSIDPAGIPTRSSWETGQKMADLMIQRHVKENGTYPKQVGIVVWATDTMKTGGDDIAYILWLLGVRPVWSASGSSVIDMEIISTDELKRPRIDVTLRISGLFRDSFPNLIEMIDDAIAKISELDESEEDNYLLKNLRKDIADSIAEGLDPITAKKKARIRIFGDPPGTYGGGVDALIETSAWKDRNDLADAYIEWGGYGYGRGMRGEDVKDFFRKRLSGIDVTVKNHESRELDAFDNDDDYIFLGGMNAAVESGSGKQPLSMIGDSSDPERPSARTLQEEGKFIFRSRVLNPKWIEGLKRHGYRGVQEISNLVEYSFGWDSTSDAMEDWMYQSMADHFLFNGDNKQWIEDNNPDALRKITSRLLEAIERGMWNASDETTERLRSLFLGSEDILEKNNDRNG
ncbi:MAG: cobaltochelatase subunit CobN [Methanomassiliicoccaceae archaeon]|nr:cobaltochelatase subunit CobN [Methanomassiliicoccaceae archaeon]